MKTATVRQVQHALSAVLGQVMKGQEIAVTKRGRVVAKIVPAHPPAKKLVWPDFEARLKRLFRNGRPRGRPASHLIYDMRKERF
jgi:prevent-host-death family protein